MAPFYARAFGLTLAADVPLPGLSPAGAGTPDVQLHLDGFPGWYREDTHRGVEIWSSDHAESAADAAAVRSVLDGRFLVVAYGDGMEFLLSRRGDEVWVRGPEGFSPETAATYLLGPVIGLLLRLRGVVCLHGSAVAVGGNRAIAFVGDAGAGKSTIAAAFALRGERVLTDDIAALSRHGSVWEVEPGVPSVRLWDDSVALLLDTPEALPLMAAGWEKRHLDLASRGAGFSADRPLPLAGVFVLVPGPDGSGAGPRRLPLREALIALVRNTYANVLLDRDLRAAEFEA
ncbi:MAG: hypothetical protein KGL38_04950, partial [Gemmatimonadota bacterium]|nr:hypothetical protein [Gemmatimonadota bacterium]